MAESGGRWGRGPATAAPPVVSVEGEGRGIVGVAGEERWRHFDSSVNAVSFGFVATAILIAMFLVMAIFERFLRPRARAPPPSRRAWHRRLWGFAGDPHSPPQHLIHDGDSPHHLRQAAFAGKLDQLPPPKVSRLLSPPYPFLQVLSSDHLRRDSVPSLRLLRLFPCNSHLLLLSLIYGRPEGTSRSRKTGKKTSSTATEN